MDMVVLSVKAYYFSISYCLNKLNQCKNKAPSGFEIPTESLIISPKAVGITSYKPPKFTFINLFSYLQLMNPLNKFSMFE